MTKEVSDDGPRYSDTPDSNPGIPSVQPNLHDLGRLRHTARSWMVVIITFATSRVLVITSIGAFGNPPAFHGRLLFGVRRAYSVVLVLLARKGSTAPLASLFPPQASRSGRTASKNVKMCLQLALITKLRAPLELRASTRLVSHLIGKQENRPRMTDYRSCKHTRMKVLFIHIKVCL
ncbi:hypothetical protein EDC04DRAFT_3086126 [Pisolithus marmoratus]|nr:hypothetical protein EDC04DRAFT_3086126 [Pisolithus marmoratus]